MGGECGRSVALGIYPDLLHICDLTLYVDALTSAFMVWTETAAYFKGRSRNARLRTLYDNYAEWCALARHFDALGWCHRTFAGLSSIMLCNYYGVVFKG